MAHGDLRHLSDLVDELMNALDSSRVAPAASAAPKASILAGEHVDPQDYSSTPSRGIRTGVLVALVIGFLALLGGLAAVMRWLRAADFAIVATLALLVFVVVLVGVLFQEGRLSEKGFVTVIRDALRRVTGSKSSR